MALLYLLRAPHDRVQLEVSLNRKAAVVLARETYTVISLLPAKYLLVATAIGVNGSPQVVAEPVEVSLVKDERKILVMSGAIERTAGSDALFLSETKVVRGARAWQEMGQTDARSLIPVLRLVLPKDGLI